MRQGLRSDRRATFTILAAGAMLALIGCAALGVDLGLFFMRRAQLQSAADAAAMAAANDPTDATAIAGRALAGNGFAASALGAATPGSYCPDPALPPAARFVPGADPPPGCGAQTGPLPNAVRIDTAARSMLGFGRMLAGRDSLPIARASIAARIDAVGLTIGTGLLSLDGGAPNAVLSRLLGARVSLDAVSYRGLAASQVRGTDLLDGLAAQAGLAAGGYDQLLGASLDIRAVLGAEIVALNRQHTADAAAAIAGLQALQAQIPAGPTVRIGQLLDLGPWRNDRIGAPSPAALQVGLNAYGLLAAAAQAATGANALAISPGFTLPGVATVALDALLIEPPQSAWYEFGPVGVGIHTAQTRLRLSVSLVNPVAIGGGALLTVPVYLELGSGSAGVAGVACGAQQASDTTVGVWAQSAPMNAWVGVIGLDALRNFARPISPADVAPAPLLALPGLVVTGRSILAVGSGDMTTLSFGQADIRAHATRRVASHGMTAGTLQSLFTGLELRANSVAAGPGTAQPVAQALAAVPLDPLLDGLLSGLGLSPGYMDVGVTGVRCRVPVLVQ